MHPIWHPATFASTRAACPDERSAGKRPAPPAEVRPQKALCQDADPRRQDVRDAAAELDAAVDVFEEATERLGNYHAKTSATMKRLDKLRAKPGTRSATWTRSWLETLNEMEKAEEQLAIEVERAEAVLDIAQKKLDAATDKLESAAAASSSRQPVSAYWEAKVEELREEEEGQTLGEMLQEYLREGAGRRRIVGQDPRGPPLLQWLRCPLRMPVRGVQQQKKCDIRGCRSRVHLPVR